MEYVVGLVVDLGVGEGVFVGAADGEEVFGMGDGVISGVIVGLGRLEGVGSIEGVGVVVVNNIMDSIAIISNIPIRAYFLEIVLIICIIVYDNYIWNNWCF